MERYEPGDRLALAFVQEKRSVYGAGNLLAFLVPLNVSYRPAMIRSDVCGSYHGMAWLGCMSNHTRGKSTNFPIDCTYLIHPLKPTHMTGGGTSTPFLGP